MVLGEADNEDGRFIFQETDFEDENFNAASFVARYRRVAPLDSLKEQLRTYSASLKQQLYEIINRDYANFIKIATKLDGIDVRVEKLRQLLVNLRMDSSSMNDLLLSSLKTINEKLHEKEKLREKRQVLETCVRCLDSLSVAEEIVSPVLVRSGHMKAGGKRSRRQLLDVIGRLKAVADEPSSGQTSLATPYSANAAATRDLYNCSEYERAAHAITFVRRSLDTLPANAAVPGHGALLRQLDQRCHQLSEQLITRLKVRMCAMFSEDISPDGRCFRHCVRALEILGRGTVVCEAFAETVTVPITNANLTQGRVDSTGGRGSYAGLTDCLQAILAGATSRQAPLFVACEELYASNDKVNTLSRDIDLIVDGVWGPVASALTERFPGMFTVGIADTFSRCFLALEAFMLSLTKVAGPRFQESVLMRIQFHPKVREFMSKWRLPLYLQLRSQEITCRIDKVCELSRTKGPLNASISQIHSSQVSVAISPSVAAIVVSPENLGSKPAAVGAPSAQSVTSVESSIAPTLSPEDVRFLIEQLQLEKVFTSNLVRAFAVEAATSLHQKINLKPLGAKFFTLSLRIWTRLEAHICALLSIATPSFPNGAGTTDAAVDTSGTLSGPTPIKRMPSNSHLSPQLPSTVAVQNIDDLMTLCKDFVSLFDWLGAQYLEFLNTTFSDQTIFEIAKNCVKTLQHKVGELRESVWVYICSLLSSNCLTSLNGVNTVTARYRMTNKPAPTTASTYVAEALDPLKQFSSKYSSVADTCAGEQTWMQSVTETVCAAFRSRVQTLMETVKSMDAALNKRSGRPKVANAGGMSDSEKILLQLLLDVQAFGTVVEGMGVSKESLPSYVVLLKEVQDGIQAASSANE